MKKKILENFHVIIFMIIIFIIPLASIIRPDVTFSDVENRRLQQLPEFSWRSVFETDYQEDFIKYVDDQIVFRNELVTFKNYLDLAQFKFEINGVYPAKDNFFIERHANYDLDLIEANVTSLNNFQNKYNAEIYLIPNANQILKDKIIYGNDANINLLLSDVENIEFVDEILLSYAGDFADLYYKTDHHWTTIGAYELYKQIVENPVELNLELVSDAFYGTIHNKLNINMQPDNIYKQKSNTIFEVFYDLETENKGLYSDKYLETKDKYSYFLDSNHGLIQIKNMDIVSNEKLLIIKDSYANCLVPFLAENYKQVDVIDLRYFNLPISSYLKNYNYDRIIVLYNKDGFATNSDVYKLDF